MDGLRAVAILAVLLFHAELGLPGGFVGVDVFFVISGFLISRLLAQEHTRGTASLSTFWMRRIRRIAPAMTAMTLAVLAAGYALLLPDDLRDLGKSALANQALAANVYFWRSTGYFDGPAHLKPLLHLWSLAVEEQFYLLYPLVFAFFWRRGRAWLLGVLAGGMVASFLVSMWAVAAHPSAAFFLLPFRAWELLAGAVAFLVPVGVSVRRPTREVLAVMGAAGVGWALWSYTRFTPFPGAAAALPVGGTALLIWANTPSLTVVGRCLAARPAVFVGLLSYSLYLWHWPVFVFLRYCLPDSNGVAVTTIALTFACAASYLSWRFVEKPLRSSADFADRLLAASWLASVVLLAGVSGFTVVTNGAAFRFTPHTRQLLASMSQRTILPAATPEGFKTDHLPRLGMMQVPPTIALLGDSHAMAVATAVDHACSSLGASCVAITHGGTLPLLGFTNAREWAADENWMTEAIDYLAAHRIKTVILIGYWQRDADTPMFGRCLRETVSALRRTGSQVIIVADTPDHATYTPQRLLQCLRSGASLTTLGLAAVDHERQSATARAEIDAVQGAGIVVIDPAEPLKDAHGNFPIVIGDECIYWDNDHLTVAGARRLIPLFRDVLAARVSAD